MAQDSFLGGSKGAQKGTDPVSACEQAASPERRGGVNPSPGAGDKGFDNSGSTLPEASAD